MSPSLALAFLYARVCLEGAFAHGHVVNTAALVLRLSSVMWSAALVSLQIRTEMWGGGVAETVALRPSFKCTSGNKIKTVIANED